MVRVGILGTCVAGSVLGVMLLGLWIGVAGLGCGGPGSGILVAGVSCPGVSVPGSFVSGSRIPDPASGIPPWDPAPGSCLGVPGPALGCRVPLFRCAQLSVRHGRAQYFASFGILHLLIQ